MSVDDSAPIPRATYRVQFAQDFGFKDAARLAPYLAALGVSHLYASPYLKARPGSAHGYDIVDHNALNPELGDEDDFRDMVAALKAAGIGQILDFVPNHMGVGGSDNAWWLDVLEWGPDAASAGYFDIDWTPDARYLEGKVLVPFLGEQYGRVLESGDLQLRFDEAAGAFAVWAYGTHKLPICPLDYRRILGHEHPELERLGDDFADLPSQRPNVVRRADELKIELARLTTQRPDMAEAVARAVAALNADLDRLDGLIGRQHWRAAFFQVAADDINYRRFFNINELAGLRMEQPELFDLTHRLILDMVADGTLDGLRIDHIDGLLDPKDYCIRLRERATRPFYLVVEKILARHERLREDWPIEGTTGYEFANLVGGLFVDPAGEKEFTRLYRDFTGIDVAFSDMVRACKIRIMDAEMASELNTLARDAASIARSNRRTCDFTTNILRAALREIVARFPVYRTYIDQSQPAAEDRRDIDWAIAQARRADDAPDASVFDFLHDLLTTDLVARPRSGFSRNAVVRLAMKVQQYSGPVMAKGLEDTAFYRYNRLVSLNEVGGHPDHFGVSVAAFHQANAERARRWPHTMLGTSTHDTKRGEDTRARLNVLSEMPEEWERRLQAWSRMVRARRGDMEGAAPPDRNDEYLLYQLLIGAWPAELTGVDALDPDAVSVFAERIEGAMIKSVREAKTHSTWASPNEEYEAALKAFVRDCLDVSRNNPFLDSFLPFQERIARLGMLNSLSQLLLKLTVPGVPDIYRGCELLDLSLVDPDNRLPVDFDRRRSLLDELAPQLGRDPAIVARLLDDWRTGAVKMAVTLAALGLRRDKPDLFAHGSYLPLEASGERAEHVCAFAREHGEDRLIVAAPRLVAGLEASPGWSGTRIALPANAARRWRNLLGGATLEVSEIDGSPALDAARMFESFPLALLVPDE
ncbi:MAG: malto-oligosyltrehalose synthase [Microvirga sp.]|nr:malto-oligosyltrehalose synthase [Microvirga sp.]